MPNLWRFLMAAFTVAAVVHNRAQSDDRYSDWRSQAAPVSDGHAAADEPYPARAEAESELPPRRLEPDGQTPPERLRKLPFRFERAPAGYDGGQVVQASALVPAKPLRKPSTAAHGERASRSAAGNERDVPSTSVVSIAGSVAVVIGLFLLVAWMARRSQGAVPPTLPRDALEVLGRKRFAGKQEMQLVRLGNKLVLIHVVPGHAETLCEVTDPTEVDRLTGICYQLHPRSSTRNFRETLDKFSQERPAARAAARPAADKLDLSIFESVGRRAS